MNQTLLPEKRDSKNAKERGTQFVASQFAALKEYAIELCSVLVDEGEKKRPRFPRVAMIWAVSELHIHQYGGYVIKARLAGNERARFLFGAEPRTGNEILNLIEGYHHALNDIHDALILERKKGSE